MARKLRTGCLVCLVALVACSCASGSDSGLTGNGSAIVTPAETAPIVTPETAVTPIPEPEPELPLPGELAASVLLTEDHLSPDEAAQYFGVEEISPGIFARMDGYSWREGALPISELRYLRTLYWGFDGGTYVGEMVVHESVAESVLEIFTQLYDAQYGIALMVLIDDFDADDTASMEANNASAFNHRLIAGTNSLSKHALGIAIDINPIQNPWVRGNAVQPESGRPYVDRSLRLPHMIDHDDLAFQLFTAAGFMWGGDWTNPRDFHHFEQ